MPLGIPPPKKTTSLLLLLIFLFETWSEKIRLSAGSLWTTFSTYTLSLRLSLGSSCLVIFVLLSVFFCFFFHFWCPCHLHLRNSGTYSDLELIHLGFVHNSPLWHLKKYYEFLLNCAIGLLIFGVDGEADQSVTNNSSLLLLLSLLISLLLLPLLRTFIVCCSRLPVFLVSFTVKPLIMSTKLYFVAYLSLNSNFSKAINLLSEPMSW